MPPRCPITNEEIIDPETLQGHAWSKLHFIDDPLCRQCGVPYALPYGDEIVCPSCIAEPLAFDAARAALVYDDESHRLIVGFKHSDRTDLAPMFAKLMHRAGKDILRPSSILLPIPLHPTRLFSRRYNQSAILAKALSERNGSTLGLQWLKRTRATPPQKNLSASARRRNVAGIFALGIDKSHIKGAHLVLIDDVLTTGATLSSAARVLKQAGAVRVDALVVARVVKGGVGVI